MGSKKAFIVTLILSTIGLIVMFFVAMSFGALDNTFSEALNAIRLNEVNENTEILIEIRMPRAIAAILVGMALAVSGAIMQGMTRNPLADPGLFGLTAGSNLFLSISLVAFPAMSYVGTIAACFLGAAFGAFLVLGLSMLKKGGFSPIRLVLAGAAVSSFLFALSQAIAIHFNTSKSMSMWTSGGLGGTSWEAVKWIAPFILIGTFIAILLSRQLTILSLSDEVATGLGQNTTFIKIALFIVVVMLAGSAVALVGNLVFVGLLIPHLARRLVGNDYRYVIPISALLGGIFMLLADTIARNINAPYETSLVAVVSVMALPFFIYVVKKGAAELS